MQVLKYIVLALFPLLATAQVISPSSVEVNMSFEARFVTAEDVGQKSLALWHIENHAQHLFGSFHSPTLVQRYGLPRMMGGVAAPQMPLAITILSKKKTGTGTEINYRASGKILVQKRAADVWLREQGVDVTLPYELDNYFDEKCTDEHYNSPGDFWYFYDPYRRGCAHLLQSPAALPVRLKITADDDRNARSNPELDRLRGDNGNGELFHIVTINGFNEDSRSVKDDGRINFEGGNRLLRARGFSESVKRINTTRPLYTYEKDVISRDGRRIHIKVERLLAATDIDSRNVTFAKFFRNALATADVVMYEGHSGLGGNLDLDALAEKAGEFTFSTGKKQILYFDSCSSYSYYLEHFRSRMPSGNADIVTNGLSSYFEVAIPSFEQFLDALLNVNESPDWDTILRRMETPLEGDSFMLNVGSV